MKIHILHTAERARTDEEFQNWIGEMFHQAVCHFRRDSGSKDDPEIQYNEATRRVRVFTRWHDFTYSVIQLTGSIEPIPSVIPETERTVIYVGNSSHTVTYPVEPVAPSGPREEGYRILSLGEKVEAGDEFYVRGTGQWKETCCAGHVVLPGSLAYRRKIAA